MRELRQVYQRVGAPGLQAEAVHAVLLEERRAEPDGEAEPRGGQAERLAGVVRRRLGQTAGRAGSHLAAAGHRGRRLRPLLEEFHHGLAVRGRDVEGREVQAVLHRGGDAGLVVAVEGDLRGRTGGGRRRSPVVHGRDRDRAGAGGADRHPRAGPADHRAPAETRLLGRCGTRPGRLLTLGVHTRRPFSVLTHERRGGPGGRHGFVVEGGWCDGSEDYFTTTAAASLESGSASAFTASEKTLRSASGTWS